MTPDACVLMARYNQWMNSRTYAAAAQLDRDALHRDRGAFFGSLFDTLNHIAVADLIWLQRFSSCQGLAPLRTALAHLPSPTSLRQPLATELPGLAALRSQLDGVISDMASRIDAPLLATTLTYRNTAGQPQARNFGQLLLHFFNHQTHHRGQASTLLFQAGIDIGVTDLVALLPDQA